MVFALRFGVVYGFCLYGFFIYTLQILYCVVVAALVVFNFNAI